MYHINLKLNILRLLCVVFFNGFKTFYFCCTTWFIYQSQEIMSSSKPMLHIIYVCVYFRDHFGLSNSWVIIKKKKNNLEGVITKKFSELPGSFRKWRGCWPPPKWPLLFTMLSSHLEVITPDHQVRPFHGPLIHLIDAGLQVHIYMYMYMYMYVNKC